MGFLDSVKNTAQRGKDSVGRKSRETQLKMQLNDIAKQRKDLMSQLGASLYEEVRMNPAFIQGREGLFDAIDKLDAQRRGIDEEIAKIEAEAAAAAAAAEAARVNRVTFPCPKCGYQLQSSDLFCSGCGMAVADYIAEQQAKLLQAQQAPQEQAGASRFCMNCGYKLSEGDLFCMKCGTRVEQSSAPEPSPAPSAAAAYAAAPAEPVEPIVDSAEASDVSEPEGFIVEKVGSPDQSEE